MAHSLHSWVFLWYKLYRRAWLPYQSFLSIYVTIQLKMKLLAIYGTGGVCPVNSFQVAKVNGKSFRRQLRRCETISKSRSILTCKFSHCVSLRIIHPFVSIIILSVIFLKLISTRFWRHNGGSGIIKFPAHISPSIRITLDLQSNLNLAGFFFKNKHFLFY